MHKRIDFDKEIPAHQNAKTKWYINNELQSYIENKQAENLPKLKGFGAFVVTGVNIEDYVLIDNKQNVLGSYCYNNEGYEQMIAKINIIKIDKAYKNHEEANV